jgi:Cation efflux family
MDGRQAPGSAADNSLPRRGLRHSAASLRARRSRGSRISLIVAFVANLVVAVAKLAAGLITGSAALLAEAAHSVADSNNEVLLAISFRRARRPADAEHPFGYGGLRFLWAFLAAIASFLIGGCLSVGLAINDLVHGSSVMTTSLPGLSWPSRLSQTGRRWSRRCARRVERPRRGASPRSGSSATPAIRR